MYLSGTTEILQVVLSGAVTTNQLDWSCSYQDINSAGMVLPQSSSQGNTNNAVDVDMVAAPIAGRTRQITIVNIYNKDTVAATVTVKKDVGGTDYVLAKYTLQSGDTLYWSKEEGWLVISGTPSTANYSFSVFTATGTYTKPEGLKFASVFCVAGGGGGGSGARNAAGTNRFGGGGGGGSSFSIRLIGANELPATLTVTVGIGGTGGAGVTVDNTNGNAGGTGTNTSFGGIVVAAAGNGGGGGSTGAGGTAGVSGQSASSIYSYAMFAASGASGATGVTGAGGNGSSGMLFSTACPGGGAGSGITSANVASTTGGNGGAIYEIGIANLGPSSGATPNGVNNKSRFLHSSPTITSGFGVGTSAAGGYPAFPNGGVGGYGAGGGGGSGSLNGTTSGAGGNGGGGLCVVLNIF